MNKPQLAESQKTALLTEAESVIRQPGRAVRLNRETDESGEARGRASVFPESVRSGEYLPGSLQGKISSDSCLKKEQMVVSAIASTPQP
ncbi:integrase [Shigella flexneri]|uniref:Integrase n=1 Tax=Shigella flexneri TaxID=623 RepID=A0A658Z4P9_SHIFL|nr:integrase [Shigella flexneri]